MKNKKSFLCVLVFLLLIPVFSEDIYISKLNIYNEKGENVIVLQKPESVIVEQTQNYRFNSLVSFKVAEVSKTGPVTSSLEASKACETLKAEHLIYGYLRKEVNSWYAELKLYNAKTKTVEQDFFASDDIDNYQRMLINLGDKISLYFQKTYKIGEKPKELIALRDFEISFPFSLSYWTPLDSAWNDVLVGVVGLNAGLEFFPPMEQKIFKTRIYDYSFRPEFSFELGVGRQSRYPGTYYSFIINIPIILNLYYSDIHLLKLGAGLNYELQLLDVLPKYDDPVFDIQNQVGFIFLCGYEYKLKEGWKLSAEIDTKIYLIPDGFLNVTLRIGANYSFYRKQGGVKNEK